MFVELEAESVLLNTSGL